MSRLPLALLLAGTALLCRPAVAQLPPEAQAAAKAAAADIAAEAATDKTGLPPEAQAAAEAAAADVAAAAAAVPLPGLPVSTGTPAGVKASTAAVAGILAETTEHELSPPWVIGEIAVTGARHTKPSAIRKEVKGRKGDLYDRPDMDRDRQSIYGLGSFDRVAVDVTPTGQPVPPQLLAAAGSTVTVKVTFIVEEKPLIGKINFDGNKKLSDGRLRDAMTLKRRDPLDEVKLREDVEKIIEKYRKTGFLSPSVRYERAADTATWTEDILFEIKEGPRSKIKLVKLEGAKAIKANRILRKLTNKRKKVYSEAEIPDDTEKIEKHYLKQGFLDIKVSTPAVTYSDDRTEIFITFPVSEGRSYKFGGTTFSGNYVFTSTTLAKALEYRKGRVFDYDRYEETVRGIQEGYAEKGRIKMRIRGEKTLNPETDLMDVEFQISEGNVVYIDYVDLEGYKNTKRHVFEREIIVKPGEAFVRSKILRSRERILNLGFIDDVGVDFQESPVDPEKVGVIFDVVEGKPGLLTAGAAYSSTDGFMGTLSLSHMNLFGRAQRTKVQWQFGARIMDYSINWTTPWILDKPTSLGLDLFNTRRTQPFGGIASAYALKQTGGGLTLGPRFKLDMYQLSIGYVWKRISIDNIDPLVRNIIAENSQIQSMANVTFARETRDNYWDPARGSRHSYGVGLSGSFLGGAIHLVKQNIYNAKHITLFSIIDWPFVLSIYNRVDYITQFGATKYVPVNDRYFIGGQDSLRGYFPGEVGFPSGGKFRQIGNVEFGFPLAREKRKTIVKLVFFADAGNAWNRLQDVDYRIGTYREQIKTNVGVGLRFVTPAFPIRLDYGYGFNHRPGEKLYQLNFGIGNLF